LDMTGAWVFDCQKELLLLWDNLKSVSLYGRYRLHTSEVYEVGDGG